MSSGRHNQKFEIDDGRHHSNYFNDYCDASDDQEIINVDENTIHESFKEKLITNAKNLLEFMERNKSEWYSREDCSVYTGTAGVAQMFYLLGKNLDDSMYTKRASELIEKSLVYAKYNKRVSYLAGSAGPLALAAVFYHSQGKEGESKRILSELNSMLNAALDEKSNELLYGKIGYLYALLFVNFNIPSRPVDEKIIKQVFATYISVIERILKDGRDYSKAQGYETPLMYQWHEKEYIGGAHGLAGILYVLLQAKEYLTEAQLQEDIEPALHYLQKIRFPSGNFPSSIGNPTDKLVHWCHGAPSMTMLFSVAHQIFKTPSFLQTAIECGEVVWTRGKLKKGYSLCHGVSGNAYTFICLYQLTGEKKHLYRACKFAEFSWGLGLSCDKLPDRPFSLFEGVAGRIYLLTDLCEPKLAKFPGYTL